MSDTEDPEQDENGLAMMAGHERLLPASVGPLPEQVEQVLEWAIQGHSQNDIEQSIRETWPDASVQQIQLAVTSKLFDAARVTPGVVHGFCIEGTREMYRKAVEMGEIGQALRALRQLWDMTNALKPRPTKP